MDKTEYSNEILKYIQSLVAVQVHDQVILTSEGAYRSEAARGFLD